jgi:EAL domain-containing protein (putative c-di-GMP-specific phosphodiesterase class I)
VAALVGPWSALVGPWSALDIPLRYRLAAERLELEITETAMLQDAETAMLQDTDTVLATLNGLHGMGVRIAMDDFGTGYSSLNDLRQFPFDKIKIDRSFIRDLGGPEESGCQVMHGLSSAETIVRAIVGLGNNLGISTTAEGVETARQFGRVCDDGCAEVQGYFISPPLPVCQISALLDAVKVRTALTAGVGESLAA